MLEVVVSFLRSYGDPFSQQCDGTNDRGSLFFEIMETTGSGVITHWRMGSVLSDLVILLSHILVN